MKRKMNNHLNNTDMQKVWKTINGIEIAKKNKGAQI